jgi:hypothetical protein
VLVVEQSTLLLVLVARVVVLDPVSTFTGLFQLHQAPHTTSMLAQLQSTLMVVIQRLLVTQRYGQQRVDCAARQQQLVPVVDAWGQLGDLLAVALFPVLLAILVL